MIIVDNVPLKLDVAEWMRHVGKFDGIKATERDWIQATCPFHDDSHPSFAVNAETGAYACQACGARGGFAKLVAHVEGHDTIFDAEQSLIVRYGRFVPEVNEELTLDFGDREEETFVSIESGMWMVKSRSAWLHAHRGIRGDVQKAFHVCETMSGDAIVLPWFNDVGYCVTVKYRSTADKRFWYDPPIAAGGLRRLLYGFDLAKDADLIVVCEGEIDAMSVVQAGHAAVALGGSHLSDTQASILRNAKASEIIVFTDNDEAGRKVRSQIVDALIGHKRVSAVDWSINSEELHDFSAKAVVKRTPHLKDANDVLLWGHEVAVQGMIESRINVPLPLRLA